MTPRSRAAGPRGFTLLELLVVVGVIALLTGLVFTLGPRVLGDQKKRATQNLLASLDRALEEYLSSNGGQYPAFSTDPAFLQDTYLNIPGPDVAAEGGDGYNSPNQFNGGDNGVTFMPYSASGSAGESYPRMPPAGAMLRQMKGFGQVDAILAGMPSKFLVSAQRDPVAGGSARVEDVTQNPIDGWTTGDWERPWPLFDGVPILFIHPRNRLAQELYGRCLNGRGYFMSAGADRLYGVTNQLKQGVVPPGVSSTPAPRTTAIPLREAGEQFIYGALKALDDNLYSTAVEPVADRDLRSSFNTGYR